MNKATLEINGKKITLELTDEQIKQLTGADDGRFKPSDSGIYYHVDSFGNVSDYRWVNSKEDHYAFSQHNVFKTKEEAEKELERLKSLAIIRDDARDWEPDWSDVQQTKYTVVFRHDTQELYVDCYVQTEQTGNIYFETRELAEQSIKDHEEHWLRVFGVNV